jgi:hypothetical protein
MLLSKEWACPASFALEAISAIERSSDTPFYVRWALALAVRSTSSVNGGIPRGAGPMASENPYDPTRGAGGGASDI